MEAIVERVCGLDVHQGSVVACVLVGAAEARPKKQTKTFGTFTRDLLQLRDWLRGEGVTSVAMESTGVYWKPVYALLEDEFQLIVGNAQRIKAVPGRKTDVRDAEWLANLARHGLIAPSFVPPKPFRELRDLLRYRRKVVEARSSERNRLLKVLELAGIKLSSVATNVFGVSGMLMLEAMANGAPAPREIAQLAKGKLRKKLEPLELALDGRLEEHHRAMLRIQLRRLERHEEDLAELQNLIADKLKPYETAAKMLRTIPGVDQIVSAVVLAELGTDMSVFHSKHHLASWAGLCPGKNESAGKSGSTRTPKGNVHLKTTLVEAAQAAVGKKGTYLKDKYGRLRARRGAKRAIIAIAHKMLISAYEILATGAPYKELGPDYLDSLSRQKVRRQLVRRLEQLGYAVELKDAGPRSAYLADMAP